MKFVRFVGAALLALVIGAMLFLGERVISLRYTPVGDIVRDHAARGADMSPEEFERRFGTLDEMWRNTFLWSARIGLPVMAIIIGSLIGLAFGRPTGVWASALGILPWTLFVSSMRQFDVESCLYSIGHVLLASAVAMGVAMLRERQRSST
jgi:hypothetical protein